MVKIGNREVKILKSQDSKSLRWETPQKPGGGDSSAAPAGLIGVEEEEEEWRSPNPPGGAPIPGGGTTSLTHVEPESTSLGFHHSIFSELYFSGLESCISLIFKTVFLRSCRLYFSNSVPHKCDWDCHHLPDSRVGGGGEQLTSQTLSFTTFFTFARFQSWCQN